MVEAAVLIMIVYYYSCINVTGTQLGKQYDVFGVHIMKRTRMYVGESFRQKFNDDVTYTVELTVAINSHKLNIKKL